MFLEMGQPEKGEALDFIAHDAASFNKGIKVRGRILARLALETGIVGEGERGEFRRPVLKPPFTIRLAPQGLKEQTRCEGQFCHLLVVKEAGLEETGAWHQPSSCAFWAGNSLQPLGQQLLHGLKGGQIAHSSFTFGMSLIL